MKESEDETMSVAEILISLADRNTDNTNHNVSPISYTIDGQHENCQSPASGPTNPTNENSCEPPTKANSTEVLVVVNRLSIN